MTTGKPSPRSEGSRHQGLPDRSRPTLTTESDRRGDRRYRRDDPVIVATEAGEVFGGIVCNRGLEGLYFESDFLVQCGVKLEIRPAGCEFPDHCQRLKGEVRWTQKLDRSGSDSRFGAGVRIHNGI